MCDVSVYVNPTKPLATWFRLLSVMSDSPYLQLLTIEVSWRLPRSCDTRCFAQLEVWVCEVLPTLGQLCLAPSSASLPVTVRVDPVSSDSVLAPASGCAQLRYSWNYSMDECCQTQMYSHSENERVPNVPLAQASRWRWRARNLHPARHGSTSLARRTSRCPINCPTSVPNLRHVLTCEWTDIHPSVNFVISSCLFSKLTARERRMYFFMLSCRKQYLPSKANLRRGTPGHTGVAGFVFWVYLNSWHVSSSHEYVSSFPLRTRTQTCVRQKSDSPGWRYLASNHRLEIEGDCPSSKFGLLHVLEVVPLEPIVIIGSEFSVKHDTTRAASRRIVNFLFLFWRCLFQGCKRDTKIRTSLLEEHLL